MQRIPVDDNVNSQQNRRFSAGGVFDAAGLQDMFFCLSQNLWLLILSIVMICLIAFHAAYSGDIFLVFKIFLCIGGILLFCIPNVLDNALFHIVACVVWAVLLVFDTVWCFTHLYQSTDKSFVENINWAGIAVFIVIAPMEIIFILIHFRLFRNRQE